MKPCVYFYKFLFESLAPISWCDHNEYTHRVVRTCFPPQKRTFQRHLEKFEPDYLLFSPLSGRFGVVEIPRCGHNHQNVENLSKLMIWMDFGDFMKSPSAIMTGMPIESCASMFSPSKANVSETFDEVWPGFCIFTTHQI